jgi:hypothetical protein
MKKIGLGLFGLVIVGTIYYFTLGSKQITSLLQQQLNTELTQMQTQGFKVSYPTTADNTQHFTIMLNDPKKALPYLNQKGLVLTLEELEDLNGSELGVDVTYLHSSVTLDLYPLSLPQSLYASSDESDKKLLQQFEAMIARKAFLVHAEVDHTGTAFTGNMKDISETLQEEDKTITIVSKGLHFQGILEDTVVKNLKQKWASFRLETSDDIHIHLLGLESTYASTGATAYDYMTEYSMETLKINGHSKGTLLVDGLNVHADSKTKEGLISQTVTTKTKSIQVRNGLKNVGLEDAALDMQINNLDINAFEKLQNTDPDDQVQMQAILEQIVSKNVEFKLRNLSVDTIKLEKKRVKGFSMNAMFAVDKTLNVAALQINPMTALGSITTNINLSLSKTLFQKLSIYPNVSLVAMFVQPEITNDTYIYRLELRNGELLVNGKSPR